MQSAMIEAKINIELHELKALWQCGVYKHDNTALMLEFKC